MPATKKPRGKPPPKSSPASPAKASGDPQVDFLILSIMSAITPMIEARCGELNKRDKNTLRRHIEKAVRSFVGKPK